MWLKKIMLVILLPVLGCTKEKLAVINKKKESKWPKDWVVPMYRAFETGDYSLHPDSPWLKRN